MTVPPEDEITPSAARTVPRPLPATTTESMSAPQPEKPSQTHARNTDSPTTKERLSALVPLTEDLAKAVTCPICLEYMEKARQLQCGHFFCAECVVRMLAMPKVRCAVCKEKTGKRMVRSAPLPFKQIVDNLRVLEGIIKDCDVGKNDDVKLNDGYNAVIASTLARIQQSRQKEPERVEPTISPASRVCALCPKGVDPTAFGDHVVFGMLRREAGGGKDPLFAHESCALFSDGVYEMDGEFENVEWTLRNTKIATCSRVVCARSNASIKCMHSGCDKRYHYPCAVVENCVLVEDGYKAFCEKHKEHAPVINQADFEKSLTDPKGEVCMLHEEACYLCHSGGRLLMCDTCERVTHPACSGLKGIPLDDWSCGVCTGVHKSPVRGESTAGTGLRNVKGSGVKRRRSESGAGNGVDERTGGASSVKRARRTSEGGKRFILSHTGLQEHQRELLRGVAKMRRTILKPDIDGRVTHLVIRAYTPDEMPTRTMKLCKAIASKTPLVCWKWVEDSSIGDSWAPMKGHIHPLTWKQSDRSIFEGKRFYFGCYSGSKDKKEEVISLVQLGGGTLVHREPSNEITNGGQDAMIYVRDEDTRKNGRRELLSRFEPPAGATIVSSTWILDQCTKNR